MKQNSTQLHLHKTLTSNNLKSTKYILLFITLLHLTKTTNAVKGFGNWMALGMQGSIALQNPDLFLLGSVGSQKSASLCKKIKSGFWSAMDPCIPSAIQLPNPLTAFVVLVKWSKVMKRRTYFVLLKLLLVSVLWRWCCCCVVTPFMMVFLLSITVLKDIIFVKPFMIMTNWCLCLFYIRRIFWKSWSFWPFTLNFVIYYVHNETPENIYFTLSHSCYLTLN